MDYDFQVLKLTESFYNNFPQSMYPEMLLKENRAYNCLLIDLHYDYFICIPFRTEIHHKNAYKFSFSKRSMAHQSGLDYSKTIIISKGEYIGNETSYVDQDEYREMVMHMDTIVNDVHRYLLDYVHHISGIKLLNEREYIRKYRYSTLKYFHAELGLDTQSQ